MSNSTMRCVISDGSKIPDRKTIWSAGYDLYSSVNTVIPPSQHAIVETGVSIEIPHGFYGQIHSKSKLAYNFGIGTIAGVVDSDYRDQINVVLVNFGVKEFHIEKGDQVAQIIILPIITPALEPVSQLSVTARSLDPSKSSGFNN